ncbi:MAG: hypothetical protein DYG89_43610 [Caldilinea sp. CFX5]|nr:hypothetical protein [Caldilinea sp. CFX5]
MTETITIMTLGESGSGKTCFLAGMYGIMRTGVRGFAFSAEDLDQDLDLSNWWETIIAEQDKTRWPEPTAQSTEYLFGFNYGLKPWLNFRWLDYRGNVLQEKETVAAADLETLRNYLMQSDAVFLCIPGDKLARDLKSIRNSAARMKQFLIPELRKRSASMDIVIVVTKSDQWLGKREWTEITQTISEEFNDFFVEGEGWTVMICPISLGLDLAQNPNAEIAPLNVHLPVVFSVYSRLDKNRINVVSNATYHRTQATEHKEKWFIPRWFASNDIKSHDEQAQAQQERSAQYERQTQKLRLELLGSEATVYFNGREGKIGL